MSDPLISVSFSSEEHAIKLEIPGGTISIKLLVSGEAETATASDPQISVSFSSEGEHAIKLEIPEWPENEFNLSDVQEQLDAAAASGTYSEGLHVTISKCMKNLYQSAECSKAAVKTACTTWQREVDVLADMAAQDHQREVGALKARIAELEAALAFRLE